MTHPKLDELCAYAQGEGSTETRSHVAHCAECTRAAARIRVGESLLAEARAYSPSHGVRWSEIDGAIAAAAEVAARGARVETLRAQRRVAAQRIAMGGVFAAAAAGLFAWRTRPVHGVNGDGAASHEAVVATGARGPSEEVARAVDATVLLVASPATVAQGEAPAQPLTLSSTLRAGTRVRTDERGGRAVIALGESLRVDARAGSELELSHWSSRDAAVSLAKGEARVEASSGAEMALHAAGWSLRSPGGVFVAKLDGDALRVHVLSGKVQVSAGSAVREARAGEVLELAKNGTALRVLSHDASDALALPAGLLATRGSALELAALAGNGLGRIELEGVSMSLSGAVSLRVAHRVRAQGFSGESRFSAELDPTLASAGEGVRAVAWAPAEPASAAVALNATNADREAPQAIRPSRGGVAPMRTAIAEAPTPSTAPVEPATPVRVVVNEADVAAATARAEAELRRRVGYCFNSCSQLGLCDPSSSMAIHVRVGDDGRVHDVDVRGVRDFTANTCVANEARASRWPEGTARSITLNVR